LALQANLREAVQLKKSLTVAAVLGSALALSACGGSSSGTASGTDTEQINALWKASTAASLSGDASKACSMFTDSGKAYVLGRVNAALISAGMPSGTYGKDCASWVSSSHQVAQVAEGKVSISKLCDVPGLKALLDSAGTATGVTCKEALGLLDTGKAPVMVATRKKLLANLNKAISKSGIKDVKVTGDRATAKDSRTPAGATVTEYFQKVDGQWKISGPA
jgi:hypothetical protein